MKKELFPDGPPNSPIAAANESQIVAAQRAYFESGVTRPVDFRVEQLRRLKQALLDNEAALGEALKADLGKSQAETYISEIFLSIYEINTTARRLKGWARPQRVKTDFVQLPARSFRIADPLGVVLIISPWNYPVQLTFMPLAGAIAAGDCVVLKPSELSPRTSSVITRLIGDTFPPEYVTVVEGGPEAAQTLLENRFDHIFFTGGSRIGRKVLRAASEHLTPVTLELGGKSPCVVDRTANIALAARRIGFSRFINAGQTCVSPDYVLVQSSVRSAFVEALTKQLTNWWGDATMPLADFSRIVNDRHFDRLTSLIESAQREGAQVIYGGASRRDERYIAPTVILGIRPDSALMEEEIFGPILPILEYDTAEEAYREISGRPKPLAAYFFSTDGRAQREFVSGVLAGGVCINDCLSHMTTVGLPFGGVGESGTGAYHGYESFRTFSHIKSVMKKANWVELPVRYPPYSKRQWMFKLMKRLFG
ncbi:MAG TPA: aldehyde dehydrogenase [Spirochaetia bacterium]|nr:aldehyde dehydrogenase [Spirochaetia bacterium]